jgi:hypothetical protein
MSAGKHQNLITAAVVALAIAGGSIAGQLTLPHVFSPNTPAKAGEVNANFDAVKAANNDTDRRLNDLGARFAPVNWQPLPFAPEWKNFAPQWQDAEFTKDAFGFVHLRGLVSGPGGAKPQIALLPVGFRPAKLEMFAVIFAGPEAAARIDVYPTGEIILPNAMLPGSYVQLSSITFFAP